MKAIAAALLILSTVLTIHFALGASPPDRPPGVAEHDWIPVSDKMGFVETTPRHFPPEFGTLAPPAEGYFMIRAGSVWQRIIIDNPLKGPGSSG